MCPPRSVRSRGRIPLKYLVEVRLKPGPWLPIKRLDQPGGAMDLDPHAVQAGLATLGTVVTLKSTIEKVLGPTADYLGTELQQFTQKRVENFARIMKRANDKVDERDENAGSVPPRVLKDVIEYGSFTEDIYVSEYFAGVMASSKSGVSRDDRGSSLTNMIIGMTSYQIRSHFLFYILIHDHFSSRTVNIGDASQAQGLRLFIPTRVIATGLDIGEGEELADLLPHIFFGLDHLGLISQFVFGSPSHLVENLPEQEFEEGGLIISPTLRGAELLLWVLAAPEVNPTNFLAFNFDSRSRPEILIESGTRAIA